MVEVKICGITKAVEIEYANKLKPEYIGFIFAESKRKVSLEATKKLEKQLEKEIIRVGVFRNNSIEDVVGIYNELPLDIIQLHGDEDITYVKELKKYISKSTKLWKAISVDENIERKIFNNYEDIDKFLLDGISPGSGQSFQWNYIKGLKLPKDIIFAGGVNGDNVLDIISRFKPSVIDVSSGVEIIDEYGTRIKSYEKMKDLIEKVRGVYER